MVSLVLFSHNHVYLQLLSLTYRSILLFGTALSREPVKKVHLLVVTTLSQL